MWEPRIGFAEKFVCCRRVPVSFRLLAMTAVSPITHSTFPSLDDSSSGGRRREPPSHWSKKERRGTIGRMFWDTFLQLYC